MPPTPSIDAHTSGAAVGANMTPSQPPAVTTPRMTGKETTLLRRESSHGMSTPPITLKPPSTASAILEIASLTPDSTKIAGNQPIWAQAPEDCIPKNSIIAIAVGDLMSEPPGSETGCAGRVLAGFFSAFSSSSTSASGSGMTPADGTSFLVLLSTIAQTTTCTTTGTTQTPKLQRHAEDPLENNADSGPTAPDARRPAVFVIIKRTWWVLWLCSLMHAGSRIFATAILAIGSMVSK